MTLTQPSLLNKKVLLGVCGSISAYKIAILIRLLKKSGAEVQVIMSPGAHLFIGATTLATLSERPALSNYTGENGTWHNHIELALWADVMLIAPATANTLAKASNGICDNLLLATYLSAKCKVIWAPAMDLDMLAHPSTLRNLEKLKAYGNLIIEPESGELASGLVGKGRLAEPEFIHQYLINFFEKQNKISLSSSVFKGQKVLITAGPTQEAIDPVRYLSNHSTGTMGFALAELLNELGAEVFLIAGSVHLKCSPEINRTDVSTADDMLKASSELIEKMDIAIFSAAVADYKVANSHQEKIKRSSSSFQLELVPNPDIAFELGKKKKSNQVFIGFALETNNEEEYALLKLNKKNFDMIVLNSLADNGAGFGTTTNKVSIYFKETYGITPKYSEVLPKKLIAQFIIETLQPIIAK